MTEHSTSRASSKKRRDGYRPNVGIVLSNHRFQVFWARRSGHDGWQFPQGGIEPNETAEQAVFRELYEEIGLKPHQVRMIGRTRDWLRYDLPRHYTSRRRSSIKGQKQIWFLFKILCDDSVVQLDTTGRPEFDDWKWVDYWQPLEDIVEFKRQVYEQALAELQDFVFPPWLIRR